MAIALALVALVAATAYLALAGPLKPSDDLDRVAVVFASHGEDGAQLAQVVALVTENGRKVELLDPETKVVIPGTSYDRLRDAYPFGGAKAVAQALTNRAGGHVSYVDVTEATWLKLLPPSTPTEITLPKPVEVFDGARMVSFAEGTNKVTAADVPLLLQGLQYLEPSQRAPVLESVSKASLAALAGSALGSKPGNSKYGPAIDTDLSTRALDRLIQALSKPE